MRHSENILQPKRSHKEGKTKLFFTAVNSITGGQGYKLSLGRLGMDNRKNFFTRRVVYHRKMLPRDAVEAPALELEDSAKAMADPI